MRSLEQIIYDRLEKKRKDHLGHFEVRRTIWPYNPGWGIVNPVTHTILDTGLPTKEEAQRICDEENAKLKEQRKIQRKTK